MAQPEERILCRTPTPGKRGTRIDRWKFDTVRRVILTSLPRSGPGVPFSELARLVRRRLSKADLAALNASPAPANHQMTRRTPCP